MKPFRTIVRRAVLLVSQVTKVLIPSVIFLMLAGDRYAVAQSARDMFNLVNTEVVPVV